MQDIIVNYWAVLAAAVSTIVVGALWYGPLLGKVWMRESGMTQVQLEEAKKKGMGKTYFLGFVFSLLTAYVLAHFVAIVGVGEVGDALQLAFWLWLGFFVPLLAGNVLWEGKSWKLFFLHAVYQFIALAVMGIILTFWH